MMHYIINIITMDQVLKLVFSKLKEVIQSKIRKKIDKKVFRKDEIIFRDRFDIKMQKLFTHYHYPNENIYVIKKYKNI
jgi:hypothetical protein